MQGYKVMQESCHVSNPWHSAARLMMDGFLMTLPGDALLKRILTSILNCILSTKCSEYEHEECEVNAGFRG